MFRQYYKGTIRHLEVVDGRIQENMKIPPREDILYQFFNFQVYSYANTGTIAYTKQQAIEEIESYGLSGLEYIGELQAIPKKEAKNCLKKSIITKKQS